MVQSVELLLDARLEATVRHEWEALSEAGVIRPFRRGGKPAVPHITVGVAASIPAQVEDALCAIDHGFGLDLRLGGLLLLGGRSSVLVRLVVPSAALLELQATVSEALRKCPGVPDTMAPGRWTPHVTLARRVGSADLATAVDVLGGRTSAKGFVAGMRRWDGDARRAWALSG
ncbi:MAG: 2'-5' RNA ligase family protein [Aeromicrobium sp.]